MGQIGFFDADARLDAPSQMRDPLEGIFRLVPLFPDCPYVSASNQGSSRRRTGNQVDQLLRCPTNPDDGQPKEG